MRETRPFLCSLCFKPIAIQNCKIFQDGRVMHDECYEEHSAYLSSSPDQKKEKKPRRGGELLDPSFQGIKKPPLRSGGATGQVKEGTGGA